ncbi:MAG TPA: NAD(P)-dependent oxidoreductase [Acidimicrobiia bacterium]|nr:NAD(P)-dependent oxidoreductase [Acidimicrobiia bacterium]
MRRPAVAIAPDYADWAGEAIVAAGGDVVDLDAAEALVWLTRRPTELADVLRSHPGLAWVHLLPAGIETLVESGVIDDGRVWTCGKGAYAAAVAEHALALILAAKHHLVEFARATTWTESLGSSLSANTVVIVGGGGIATELIRLLVPFGCEIVVVRHRGLPLDGATRVTTDIDAVVSKADVVVLAAAVTDHTVRLLGRRRFEAMRPDAIVVNVARGRLIDTDALVEALANNRIGAACLDVTDPEPLPDDHPLWRFDNCLITPHTANPPDLTLPAAVRRLTDNIRRWAAGEPLIGVIDPSLGY